MGSEPIPDDPIPAKDWIAIVRRHSHQAGCRFRSLEAFQVQSTSREATPRGSESRVLIPFRNTGLLHSLRGGEAQDLSSFVCASDASFGDNTLDRKSSQGYIMKLFGGAVAWRANKQDMVATSSTEAELLAISQTAKEAIYLSRMMKALNLSLPEPLTIDCDNAHPNPNSSRFN